MPSLNTNFTKPFSSPVPIVRLIDESRSPVKIAFSCMITVPGPWKYTWVGKFEVATRIAEFSFPKTTLEMLLNAENSACVTSLVVSAGTLYVPSL